MHMSRIITIAVVLGIFGYLGVNVVRLVAPPPLDLTSPVQNYITSNKIVEIKGTTLTGAKVEVNGRPLTTDREGVFESTLVLNKGLNTVTISAKKRYGRPTVRSRQIFITETNSISQTQTGGI